MAHIRGVRKSINNSSNKSRELPVPAFGWEKKKNNDLMYGRTGLPLFLLQFVHCVHACRIVIINRTLQVYCAHEGVTKTFKTCCHSQQSSCLFVIFLACLSLLSNILKSGHWNYSAACVQAKNPAPVTQMKGELEAKIPRCCKDKKLKQMNLNKDDILHFAKSFALHFCEQLLTVCPIRIRIRSGFNQVSGSGSGFGREKMSYKNWKKFRNSMFGSAGCSLLRAEGFSFSLDIL